MKIEETNLIKTNLKLPSINQFRKTMIQSRIRINRLREEWKR